MCCAHEADYAEQVGKARVYLHPLDAFLLAEKRGKHMHVVMAEKGLELEICSQRAALAAVAPEFPQCGFLSAKRAPTPLAAEDLHACPSGKDTWIFVCSNFANGRAAACALNHFMPAWHRDQLGEESWKHCRAIAHSEHEARLQEIERLKGELDDPASDLEEEDRGAYLADLQERKWQFESQWELMLDLEKLGLHCEDVPGDGDCALHTIQALMDGKPRALEPKDVDLGLCQQKNMALRQDRHKSMS